MLRQIATPQDDAGAKLRRDAGLIALLVGGLTLVAAHIFHSDARILVVVALQVAIIKALGWVLSPWA